MRNYKVAVIVPCYKRPEYTALCLKALKEAQDYPNIEFYMVDDGSCDETENILRSSDLPANITVHNETIGLRNTLVDFFEVIKDRNFDIIAKVDNDCIVPKNWLFDILEVFEKSDADILSPNVFPSNAAFKLGECDKDKKGFRPSATVGGLWVMKKSMIEDIMFEKHEIFGIKGAYNLLYQIIINKDPVIGWVDKVTVQDLGHWSGLHPEHIKSQAHADYSREIGRGIGW